METHDKRERQTREKTHHNHHHGQKMPVAGCHTSTIELPRILHVGILRLLIRRSRRSLLISHRFPVSVFDGIRGENALHGGGVVGRSLYLLILNNIAVDGVDQEILFGSVDVDKEIGGWRVGIILVPENFVHIVDFGHVLVVVFAPDVLLEVLDIDPVMAK